MKGPPWWCWWRAGANLVALPCDTHKSSSQKKKENEDDPQNRVKKKWKVVQVVFLFFLWAVRPMLFYRAMAARGPQDSSPSGYLPLCVEDEWNSLQFWSFEITMTYPFLSIFGWVLVHMMLGDYLWPILPTQLANQELHLQGEKTAGSFPSGTLSISCARIGPHVWPPPNPGVASR